MNIVFNVNPLGLEGLGATLTSLIRNCSNPQALKLWFFCSGFRKDDKLNIEKLLNGEAFTGKIEYVDFDAKKVFGHLRSLHGDWTAYGRLLIPNYILDDNALYLDSDLVILLDVLTLENFDFKGNLLAAAYGCTIDWTLDKSFFINLLKWPLDKEYFNSGIVLFNLKAWRDTEAEAKWKELAKAYPNDLISHDQTLLNAICEGKFAHLTPDFNNGWVPGAQKPEDADKSILHFVGSPKPWDIFGRFVHKGYPVWKAYSTSSWEKEYGTTTIPKIERTWNIRKSIAKHLLNKILNK